jgi:hypothetical protein
MAVPSSLCCEHGCFTWLRRSLLAQPFSLEGEAPCHVESRCRKRKSSMGPSKLATVHRSKEEDEDVI